MASIDQSAIMLRGSVVERDVTLRKDVGVWYNAVLRADCNSIVVGNPAKVIRPATEEEIALNVVSAQTYVEDIKKASR